MLTWLLLLAPIVVVFIVIRVYQKKTAEREAASSKRFDEIFGGVNKAPPPQPIALPERTAPRPATAAAPVTPAWVAKSRFLEPQGKLLYYLLKSELSDHEVFAQVGVNAVIAVASASASVYAVRNMPEGIIDFVVCDKQMKPLAAIRLAETLGADTVAECIKSAGLRWVSIAPGALPARDQVRRVVLGG